MAIGRTEAGTPTVKDLYRGAEGSGPCEFSDLGGVVFFTAEPATGRELWSPSPG